MQYHLFPRCSIMSVVRVDLPFLSNASEAAFLNRADPAMHPKTVGLDFGSLLEASSRAHAVNTATLAPREMTILRDMMCKKIPRGCVWFSSKKKPHPLPIFH